MIKLSTFSHFQANKLIEECVSIPGFLTHQDLASMLDIMDEFCPENELPIAEVGVYCGRSTHLLSKYGYVIGIDGFVMDGLIDQPTIKRLTLINSYSTKYKFVSEIWPMMSLAGAKKAAEKGIKFKAIFIDASHDYKSIKEDLIAWKPLLADGGLLFGDDHTKDFPGVEQALKEFESYETAPHGKIWYIKKKEI